MIYGIAKHAEAFGPDHEDATLFFDDISASNVDDLVQTLQTLGFQTDSIDSKRLERELFEGGAVLDINRVAQVYPGPINADGDGDGDILQKWEIVLTFDAEEE